METIEIWKDVLDFEGLYQVSNLGRVCNSITGRIMKPKINYSGYVVIGICKNKKQYQKRVNRLVWEAFNGKTNLHIDHIIEGNKNDNRLCNLQALNGRQNVAKYYLSKPKSSQFTGVSWNKKAKKWKSTIRVDGGNKHLGLFTEEYEAHLAYLKSINNL
jgi:hypothetical protein